LSLLVIYFKYDILGMKRLSLYHIFVLALKVKGGKMNVLLPDLDYDTGIEGV